MKNIRIGAVNWDASLPRDTYFGFYQTNSLSPEKYRTWTPYYASIDEADSISYKRRTPKEYEKEISYARTAGIDYFAFVWYPKEGSERHIQTGHKDCSHKVHELNYARELYEKCTDKYGVNMCAILSAHPFTDADLEELVEAFRSPWYEKIGTRPLLYIYLGYREEIIKKIHELCKKRNVPKPYTVIMEFDPKDNKYPLGDALSAYAICESGITTHRELIECAKDHNRKRLTAGLPLIPTFTVGWNPRPRIERPTPWTSTPDWVSLYADEDYAPKASCEELYLGAESFCDFLLKEGKEAFIGHVLTFAWNEFEEGGYICPTYTENGETDITRVEIFKKISDTMRRRLGEI